jgi:hypothetical protein
MAPQTGPACSGGCGGEAIGDCVDCGRPVCSLHSGFIADDLLCESDISARKSAAAESAQIDRDNALRTIDARTSLAVTEFLDRAASIEPLHLAVSSRLVVETIPGARRGLLRRWPDRSVKKRVFVHAPGHRISRLVYDRRGDPPEEIAQELWVMISGELILKGGHGMFAKGVESVMAGWTRGVGLLPGFLTDGGNLLAPGLPSRVDIGTLEPTAAWLDRRIADYLSLASL